MEIINVKKHVCAGRRAQPCCGTDQARYKSTQHHKASESGKIRVCTASQESAMLSHECAQQHHKSLHCITRVCNVITRVCTTASQESAQHHTSVHNSITRVCTTASQECARHHKSLHSITMRLSQVRQEPWLPWWGRQTFDAFIASGAGVKPCLQYFIILYPNLCHLIPPYCTVPST